MPRSSESLIESRLHHLRNEVSAWAGYVPGERLSPLLELLDGVLGRPNAAFDELKKAYDRLSFEKAVMLHERTEVAASYQSMDEFWADADAQERGNSLRTFWDTYEHGRRRQIESQLASCYGCEEALLVNSGMSAIDTAVRSLHLKSGDVILTHRRGYFETAQYLADILRPEGVVIVRRSLDDRDELQAAVEEVKPRLLLVEAAMNIPPCEIVSCLDGVPDGVQIVIDNSLFSPGVRWFDHVRQRHAVVVESAIKYLMGHASGGVLYGSHERIGAARHYARNVGQQLQERAFNHLQAGEIATLRDKVRLQGNRAALFARALEARDWARTSSPAMAASGRDDWPARAVREVDGGCLVFLELPENVSEGKAALHRRILQAWRNELDRRGVALPIRAGFGWDETSARCYESARLNQPDAPMYIRVSVGIEPPDQVATLAECLNLAVRSAVT
jgi:cystathionine beta-lyase/cystathionine gamma-synthase